MLDCLRADDSWQRDGIIVGEPVTRIVLPKRKGDPAPEPQTVLVNQMQLTPRRTEMLVRLLEKHETQLRELAEEEEKESRRAFSDVYRYLVSLGTRKRAQGESEQGPSAAQDDASEGAEF